MIDLHTHILPGVDDGARTLDDALDMARAFVADGMTAIAATPHVRDDYPTSSDAMLRAVDALRQALEGKGIPLTVLPGAELAVEWLARLGKAELGRLTLAGSGRYILVETPYYGWPLGLPDSLFSLRAHGITPVLAHPERNAEVQASPERLSELVESGVLVQVTAASVDGRIGQRARDCGLQLIREGLAHLLASDAHHASVRAVGMGAAAESVGGKDLATWLTRDVPAAIVGDTPIPPRPDGGS